MLQENHKPHHTLTVMEGRAENSKITDDLATAAKAKGWDFCLLPGINSDKIARLDFSDIPLDFVIFRELSQNNYHETERVMDWLHRHRKIGVNLNVAGGRISTSDKHYQQGLFLAEPLLAQYATPTFEAKHKLNVISYIQNHRVHYPFVLKPRRGTVGRGIILIKNEADLDKVGNFGNLLIEQYIEPECDFRVFVIGGVAVGAMRKIGDPDNPADFHVWSGGFERFTEQNPTILDTLSEIATRVASVAKLEYAGIDIIREKHTGNYFVLETNIAAGWENFIPITHINIPDLVIDWFEDIDDGRHQPFAAAVTSYVEKRLKYLPTRIQESYQAILSGDPTALESYRGIFQRYPDKYLYDAGRIFKQLSEAYQDVTSHPENITNYQTLLREIEAMPLSWAGNFIGPEVGTMHDGAILSALYLYLLHKTEKI